MLGEVKEIDAGGDQTKHRRGRYYIFHSCGVKISIMGGDTCSMLEGG